MKRYTSNSIDASDGFNGGKASENETEMMNMVENSRQTFDFVVVFFLVNCLTQRCPIQCILTCALRFFSGLD